MSQKSHCAECRYAECRGAIKTRNAECHSLTHYAKRCFTGCRGATMRIFQRVLTAGNLMVRGRRMNGKTLKKILARGPGANIIKLFPSVIYEFLYQAGVFNRRGWKSLPGKTLACCENSQMSDKNVF